ncbi:MAG: GWxTD domain-containing protein, partial [Bacteroidota bacterium]
QMKYFICKQGQQDQPIPGLLGFRKQDPAEVNPVIMNLNIENLEQGAYELVIEIRNQQNEFVASKAVTIQRSKPEVVMEDYLAVDLSNSFTLDLDRDRLERGLKSLTPVINTNYVPLIREALSSKDDNVLRKLLHQYYYAKNELYPDEPYGLYMKRVTEANALFGSLIDEGYETDRGYTYLKYGVPSDMVDVPDEINTYPYQIWVYYETPKGERNVKFVFYNPSLAGDNYVILHSTARDEITDRAWQRKLYKNNPVAGNRDNLEGTQVDTYFGGGRAGDFFNDY